MKGTFSSAARWIGRAAVFPCLGTWLLVRLWIPLGGLFPDALLIILAALLSALLLFLVWKLPLFLWSKLAVVATGLFFVLGTVFDISYAMLQQENFFLTAPPLRMLCHLGNGIVLAAIVFSLVSALPELRGLGCRNLPQFFLLLALLNGLTALYVFTSHTVYFWDNAGYWTTAQTLAQEPLDFTQIHTVLASTIDMDYNYLLAWPISLIMRLFGKSRAVFLFAVSNLYTFPGLCAMSTLTKDKKWNGLFLFFLFPMFVYTGLTGFVDTAACSLALWACVVYLSGRPAVSRGIVSGILLVGAFLLRRYFFFFAASFGLAAFGKTLLFSRRRWADFTALLLTSGACAIAFSYRFLLDKVIGTNYSDLYSAYDLGLVSDGLLFCHCFGLILLVALVLRALTAIVCGVGRVRAVFALLQIISCFLAFVSVQSHGQQHILLYLPCLAVIASLPPRTAYSRQIPSLVLAGVVSLRCLIPVPFSLSFGSFVVPHLLPAFTFYGDSRNDIEQLNALTDYIHSLSRDEQHTAVVLASSFTLNRDILVNLYTSLNLPEPEKQTVIQGHGDVDKRDPFNWNTAFVDYLIIGDPIQTHLGVENQQVISYLAQDVLNGTGVGAAYQQLPQTFSLENQVTVRIFQRTRGWSLEDFQEVSQYLIARYPDYEEEYQYPDWIQ